MKLLVKYVMFSEGIHIANNIRQSMAIREENTPPPNGFGVALCAAMEATPLGILVTVNKGDMERPLVPWAKVNMARVVRVDEPDTDALRAKVAELEVENLELKTRPAQEKRR